MVSKRRPVTKTKPSAGDGKGKGRNIAPLVLPSASALGRVFACPDSEVISPRAIEAPSVYTARGDTVHEFIQAIATGTPRDEALERIDPDDPGRGICEALAVDELPTGGHFELALAWDIRTSKGRVLGTNIGRDYKGAGAKRDVEFVGSFDFAGKHITGHGVLVDWKSGWRTVRARDSWQLKAGAVFLADAFGLEEVEAAHLYVRENEDPKWDPVFLDSMALAGAREELRQLAAVLATRRETGLVVEGQHCRYCPAYRSCPAKVGLARSLVQLKPPGELTVEKAKEGFLLLEKYDEIAKRIRGEIEAFALDHPVDLGDGRVLKLAPGEAKDAVTNPALALDTIAAMCGESVARAAASSSKKAIETALGGWAKEQGTPAAPVVRDMIAKLRDLKAIEKRTPEDKVRIVKEGRP